MSRGNKRTISSCPTPTASIQNESSRHKQARCRAQGHQDIDDPGATLHGTTNNNSEPLIRGDIPALVQEIIKILATDGGSSTQQGDQEEGQSNNNIANTSSSLPQQSEQQGCQSNSNITNTSSSQPQ